MCSLTPAHWGAWLPGVQHTAELDSAVGSTSRSLTPWWDAHRRVFEKVGTLDSAVCCTLRSSTPRWDAHRRVRLIGKCPFFVNSYLLRLSTPFFQKTSELKKISWTICDLQYQFHINIFRHHREIAFVKLRIKTDTWQVIDSAMWCTPLSLTPQWDAHQGAF